MAISQRISFELNSAVNQARQAAHSLSQQDSNAANSLLRAFNHLHNAILELSREVDRKANAD